MKKLLIGLATVFLALALALPTLAEDKIVVLVNGENLAMEQAPVIQDGRTLVPMRAIFEALGANVDWVADTKTVFASKGFMMISLTIDNKEMLVDGNTVQLEVPAQLINGRTMVPVRAISEALKAAVNWDQATKTISITEAPSEHQIKYLSKSLEEKAADGTVLATFSCQYPQITDSKGEAGIATINAKYAFNDTYTTEFYGDILSGAKAAYAELGSEFIASSEDIRSDIPYDHQGIISIVQDDSIYYSNAAHPTTFRSAETYNLATGQALTLTDILDLGMEQIYPLIIDGVNAQIKANPGNYLVEAITETDLDGMCYYLSEQGLVCCFQQYAIAPYAAGFPEYIITFADHADLFAANIGK